MPTPEGHMDEDDIMRQDMVDHLTVTPTSEFLCDDGNVRTWAQLCDGIDEDLSPDCPGISEREHLARYRLLLVAFGACRIG